MPAPTIITFLVLLAAPNIPGDVSIVVVGALSLSSQDTMKDAPAESIKLLLINSRLVISDMIFYIFSGAVIPKIASPAFRIICVALQRFFRAYDNGILSILITL